MCPAVFIPVSSDRRVSCTSRGALHQPTYGVHYSTTIISACYPDYLTVVVQPKRIYPVHNPASERRVRTPGSTDDGRPRLASGGRLGIRTAARSYPAARTPQRHLRVTSDTKTYVPGGRVLLSRHQGAIGRKRLFCTPIARQPLSNTVNQNPAYPPSQVPGSSLYGVSIWTWRAATSSTKGGVQSYLAVGRVSCCNRQVCDGTWCVAA